MRTSVKYACYFLALFLVIFISLSLPIFEDCETDAVGEHTVCGKFPPAHYIASWFNAHGPTISWISALSAFFSTVFAGTLLVFSKTMADEARRQRNLTIRTVRVAIRNAKDAKRSADTAETTLEATHRPWLTITEILPSKIEENLPGTCHLILDAVVKNVGNSPAIGVDVSAIPLYEVSVDDDAIEMHVGSWLSAMINSPIQRGRGQTLFHQESAKYYYNIQSGGVPKGRNVSDGIKVAVCVTYGFPFSEKDDLYTVSVFSVLRVQSVTHPPRAPFLAPEKPKWIIDKIRTYTN